MSSSSLLNRLQTKVVDQSFGVACGAVASGLLAVFIFWVPSCDYLTLGFEETSPPSTQLTATITNESWDSIDQFRISGAVSFPSVITLKGSDDSKPIPINIPSKQVTTGFGHPVAFKKSEISISPTHKVILSARTNTKDAVHLNTLLVGGTNFGVELEWLRRASAIRIGIIGCIVGIMLIGVGWELYRWRKRRKTRGAFNQWCKYSFAHPSSSEHLRYMIRRRGDAVKLPEPTKMTDSQLAAALAQASPSSQIISEVYTRYRPAMLWVAHRALGRYHDFAEDVVADTLVRVLLKRSVAALRNPERLKAYLMAAAQNAARDLIRKLRREELTQTPGEGVDPTEAFLDAETEREQAAATASKMEQVVATLGKRDQQIVKLRFDEGLDLAAIAQELGISYAAAAQRLSRAIRRARRNALRLGG